MADERLCSAEGCDKPVFRRNFCYSHYSKAPRVRQKPPESGICTIDGCDKPHKSRGWCAAHYDKFLVYGDPLADHKRLRPTCKIDGCDKKHFGHGFCTAHWRRNKVYGDPLGGKRSLHGDAQKFYRETVLTYTGEECLIWPFSRLKSGYAKIWMPDRDTRLVCRLICEDLLGPPPSPDHHAAHTCGNGHLGCCAPPHCTWKTPVANNADKLIHGTHNRGTQNYSAKLTETDVREIRASSKSVKDISEQFGITQSHAYSIIRRERWAWLKD